MFPAGMLGAPRRLKRYGVQMKGGGAGGGGADGTWAGGNGGTGQELRFDVLANQFDVLDILLGGGGTAGSKDPYDPLASPVGGPGGGYRSGGTAGSGITSGSGGHGAGSTGASLRSRLLGAAGGGGGGGGGSANRAGADQSGSNVNPAAMPTDGTGQPGESATSDGGGGGGGGGGVDGDRPGGQGGCKGGDNSVSAGGGRPGASWADPAVTLPFTGTAADLSAYGKGGRGGNSVAAYSGRVGDGENGTRGVALVTDYETGQSYWITANQGFTLP